MSYAADHASAHAEVRANGTGIVFTLDTRTEDASGIVSRVTTTQLGVATELPGAEAQEFAAVGLAVHEGIKLFVVNDVYGDTPPMGASALFGGVTRRVRSVKPYRPDGVTLFSEVILGS